MTRLFFLATPSQRGRRLCWTSWAARAGGESVLVANPNYAPAFIVHGTADLTAPYAWDLNLSNKLTEIGVYNELNTIVGGGHSLNINTFNLLMPNGKTLLENNMIFLASRLVPEPSSFAIAAIGLSALIVWSWRQKQKFERETEQLTDSVF